MNHDSASRRSPTELPVYRSATRYCRNTNSRTARGIRQRRQTDTRRRSPRLFVGRRSVRLGSHHPPQPQSPSLPRPSASGDRHQRDLPNYVAQSDQRSLSLSSPSSVNTLNIRLSRGGVDFDVVVAAADSPRLRNVTYLLRAQLSSLTASSLSITLPKFNCLYLN